MNHLSINLYSSRLYSSPAYTCGKPGSDASRIWSLAQRAIRQSASQRSRRPGVALKFILGPAVLTVSARLFGCVAYCEADVNNNAPEEVVTKDTVPEFKWHILWEFVRPQLLALIGAVVVSVNQLI